MGKMNLRGLQPSDTTPVLFNGWIDAVNSKIESGWTDLGKIKWPQKRNLKGLQQTFLQRRYAEGQWAHDKRLNISSH